jgi:hypothetical protein
MVINKEQQYFNNHPKIEDIITKYNFILYFLSINFFYLTGHNICHKMKLSKPNYIPDKAKPLVRTGRKAAGLEGRWPSCRRT